MIMKLLFFSQRMNTLLLLLNLLLLNTSFCHSFTIVPIQSSNISNNNNNNNNNNHHKRNRRKNHLLQQTNNENNGNKNNFEFNSSSQRRVDNIRFLGKGNRAVIRPGVVLVAPKHEYSHWLMKSVVFVHAIGIDEYGEHVTRGVIIDHPTPFTMGEMGSVYGSLGLNLLFRGGDAGNDSAIVLHSYGRNNDSSNNDDNVDIDCGDMIGCSGVYEGGLANAMELADAGIVDTERFKFFFNYVQFTDNELKNILNETDTDGDAWASLEVSSEIVLDNHYDRGDAWSFLRNQMKQMMII